MVQLVQEMLIISVGGMNLTLVHYQERQSVHYQAYNHRHSHAVAPMQWNLHPHTRLFDTFGRSAWLFDGLLDSCSILRPKWADGTCNRAAEADYSACHHVHAIRCPHRLPANCGTLG